MSKLLIDIPEFKNGGLDVYDDIWDWGTYIPYIEGTPEDAYDQFCKYLSEHLEVVKLSGAYGVVCKVSKFIYDNFDAFTKAFNELNNEFYAPESYPDVDFKKQALGGGGEDFYDIYMSSLEQMLMGNYSERDYQILNNYLKANPSNTSDNNPEEPLKEALSEEFVRVPDEILSEFETKMEENGWELDDVTSRYGSKNFYDKNVHYQFITTNPIDENDFDNTCEAVQNLLDEFEDTYDIPITFNVGLISEGEYKGKCAMGVDLRAMYLGKPGEDTVSKGVPGTKIYFKNGKPADEATKAKLQDIADKTGIKADDIGDFIGVDKPKKESLDLTESEKEHMTFAELSSKMREHNKENNITSQYGDPNPIIGVAVISNDSFTKDYPLSDRSYKFRSDNKYFIPEMGGNSIFATSLKGNDHPRLDWYLDTWKIEYCYIDNSLKENLTEASTSEKTKMKQELDNLMKIRVERKLTPEESELASYLDSKLSKLDDGDLFESYGYGKSRDELISGLKEIGKNYNFDRFPTEQLYHIYNKEMEKYYSSLDPVDKIEYNMDEVEHCPNCGRRLNDNGECVVCDLFENPEDYKESFNKGEGEDKMKDMENIKAEVQATLDEKKSKRIAKFKKLANMQENDVLTEDKLKEDTVNYSLDRTCVEEGCSKDKLIKELLEEGKLNEGE